MTDTAQQPAAKYARASTGPQYLCRFPWPADCSVQCGRSGIVLSAKGNYRTAFFEAFPDTFIRGQGKTVEEAEEAAWEKYQKQRDCPEHLYERRGQSEHGQCSRCGHLATEVFRPVHFCVVCAKPEVNLGFEGGMFCLEHYLEVARDPDANAKLYPSSPATGIEGLFSGIDLKAIYLASVWDFEVLAQYGLVPPGTEDYQVSKYLFGTQLGVCLSSGRREIVRQYYKRWIEHFPDRPVGALMFSQLEDVVFVEEGPCKAATIEFLFQSGLVPHEATDEAKTTLQGRLDEQFEVLAARFAELRTSH